MPTGRGGGHAASSSRWDGYQSAAKFCRLPPAGQPCYTKTQGAENLARHTLSNHRSGDLMEYPVKTAAPSELESPCLVLGIFSGLFFLLVGRQGFEPRTKGL